MKEELKNIILNHKKNLIIVGDNFSEKTRKVIFPIIDDKINEMLASIKPSKPIVTNEEMNKMNETINKLEDNNLNNIKRYNENITNSLDKEMANKNHHSIDELIKKIDEKIAEIEKQEKLYQENDENN